MWDFLGKWVESGGSNDVVYALYQNAPGQATSHFGRTPIVAQVTGAAAATVTDFGKYLAWQPAATGPGYDELVASQDNPSDALTVYWDPASRDILQWVAPSSMSKGQPTPHFSIVHCRRESQMSLGYTGPIATRHALELSSHTPSLSEIRQKKKCIGGDFVGVDFTGADLSGLDLSKADFTDAILKDADLTASTLTGAKLTGATLTGTVFADIDFSGYSFAGLDLTGASFAGCKVDRANFRGCVLHGVNFSKTDLSRTDFDTSPDFSYDATQPMNFAAATLPFTLIGRKWDFFILDRAKVTGLPSPLSSKATPLSAKHTQLQQFDLLGADLTHADLSDTNLQSANLASARLVATDLSGAQVGTSASATTHTSLDGAFLQDVTLNLTHFEYCFLTNAQFYGVYSTAHSSDFTGAKLSGSNLSHVDFSANSATEATLFSDASLDGTLLIGAKLNHAKFDGSASLAGAHLQGADFANADMAAADLTGAAVSVEDPVDYLALGVPIFAHVVAASDRVSLVTALDNLDVVAAGLENMFAHHNLPNFFSDLGDNPTLVASTKARRWLLSADPKIAADIAKNSMSGTSGYTSFYLVLDTAAANPAFHVFAANIWYTVTDQNNMTIQLARSVSDLGVTTLPSPLPQGMLCPNGQRYSNQPNAQYWTIMTAMQPPAAAGCIADPINHHFCPANAQLHQDLRDD